jgi:hypothetical protein
MLLYEIWSLGGKPYPNKGPTDIINAFYKREDYLQPPPPECPTQIYKIMLLCWNYDHHSRPSFDDIISLLQESETNLQVYTVTTELGGNQELS